MTTGNIRWSRLFRRGQVKAIAGAEATTGGSVQSGEPLEVYVAANQLEAEVVKSFLQSFDIPVILRNEAMGTVLGVVVGPLAEVKVLVPQPLAGRAQQLLEEQAGEEMPDDGDEEVG